MLDIDFTFLFTAVNLIVLYLILRKVLFKRVGEHMRKRSEAIAAAVADAEAQKAEVARLKQEYADIIDAAKQERSQIIEEAREKALKEYEGIIAEARHESEKIVTSAQEQTVRERERMLQSVHNEVVDIAIAAASKVIESNMDDEINRQAVDKFINDRGVA